MSVFAGWTGGYMFGVISSFIVFTLLVFTDPDGGPGYKQGQVDALTGKVKYVLVEKSDKTKVWIRDANWNKNDTK